MNELKCCYMNYYVLVEDLGVIEAAGTSVVESTEMAL